MEKIHTLIDKLCQQKNQNLSPAHLLFTVQMLHAELLQLDQKNAAMGTSRVAVSLPVNLNFVEEIVFNAIRQAEEADAVQTLAKEKQKTEQAEVPPVQETEKAEYTLRKPALNTAPAVQSQPVLNHAFGYEAEAPTIAQYTQPAPQPEPKAPEKEIFELKPTKELHEMLGQKNDSLNDRLKEEKTELGHKLNGAPVKDLRKAIGINDRFTFINELFRGDEVMYERSLKTINAFNIYSEAEYWMQRELMLKLGWQDTNPTVREFYSLVRRRFS